MVPMAVRVSLGVLRGGVWQMSGEIRGSEAAAQQGIAEVWQGEADYMSFSIGEISGVLPVAASGTHDGICAQMARSLSEWGKTVERDAGAIGRLYDTLRLADEEAAFRLPGVPGATAGGRGAAAGGGRQ